MYHVCSNQCFHFNTSAKWFTKFT